MDKGLVTVSIDLGVMDRFTAKEVLHAILHSILFHRLFGTIKPKTLEVLDVTLPGINDPEIEKEVTAQVDSFWRAIESGSTKRGSIQVTFSEKRPKKSWFSMGEEEVPWEQWVINAEIRQPKTEQERQQPPSTRLSQALSTILTHTASEKGRAIVPPITNSTGISPFPYKFTLRVGGVEV